MRLIRLYRRAINAGHRRTYRLVYPIACLWFRRRASVEIAVWVQDQVLLVRHSYRDGLTLPGGHIGWREEPREAARRELWEEVGLVVDPAALILNLHAKQGLARSYSFAIHLDTIPPIRIDQREIIFASFMAPGATITDPCKPRVHTMDMAA